jgi:uncharacterized membrane protein YdjX (TVP38/TMEM64 family)
LPASVTTSERAARTIQVSVALLLIASVVGGAAGLAHFRQDLLVSFINGRDMLLALVEEHRLAAITGFVAVYVVYVAIGLPASFILTVAGAFLFGWPLGLALSILAASTGAIILVLLARYAFAPLAERLAGPRVRALAAGFNSDAVNYMLFLRLVTIFPFWFVTMAAGIFRVPLTVFIPTTVIGMAPAAFAFSMVGQGLDHVLARAALELAECRASGSASCAPDLGSLDLAQPKLMFGSVMVGLLALVPIGLRLVRRYWSAAPVQK